MTLITLAYAFQDVVSDGLMVESGQRLDMTGQFQSIQWTAVYIAMIITSFAGGIIADLAKAGSLSYRLIFAGDLAFPDANRGRFGVVRQEPAENQPERMAGLNLRNIFRRKGIWISLSSSSLELFSVLRGAVFYYAVDT